MNKINITKIIADNNLNKKNVAEQLFPGNKYSSLALNRVIAGEGKLDSDQISKLALLADISIEEIYGVKFTVKGKEKKMFFEYEDFKAELNRETWTTKVFHNDSLFHESIIHKSTIALSDYLEELTNIINKFKNDEQNS